MRRPPPLPLVLFPSLRIASSAGPVRRGLGPGGRNLSATGPDRGDASQKLYRYGICAPPGLAQVADGYGTGSLAAVPG